MGSEAHPFDEIPAGCHSLNCEWPWPECLPGTGFSTLHFEVEPLCHADFKAWGIALPDRLKAAAAKRRAEFVGGRLTARRALASLTGTPFAPPPDAEQLPDWPAGVVGSITHSQGLAAAVVARQNAFQGIGLDAELIMSAARARRLAPQILVPAEKEWLETLPIDQQGAFVTLVFSLKESLFKALYPIVRQRFYFPDARLRTWDARTGQVSIELLKTLSPAWPQNSRLSGQVTQIGDYLLTLIAIPGKL